MAQFVAAGRGGEKVGGVVIEVHYHPPAISAKKHGPIVVSPILKTEAKTPGPQKLSSEYASEYAGPSAKDFISHNIWMTHWGLLTETKRHLTNHGTIHQHSRKSNETKTIPRSLVEVWPSGAGTWTGYEII